MALTYYYSVTEMVAPKERYPRFLSDVFQLVSQSRASGSVKYEIIRISILAETIDKMVMNRGLHLIPPPPRWQVNLAKAIGASMWCWIFWRLKQDWRELMVSTVLMR